MVTYNLQTVTRKPGSICNVATCKNVRRNPQNVTSNPQTTNNKRLQKQRQRKKAENHTICTQMKKQNATDATKHTNLVSEMSKAQDYMPGY